MTAKEFVTAYSAAKGRYDPEFFGLNAKTVIHREDDGDIVLKTVFPRHNRLVFIFPNGDISRWVTHGIIPGDMVELADHENFEQIERHFQALRIKKKKKKAGRKRTRQ